MPPSVACADVLTSTGNHSPCGLSHAFSCVEHDARLDGHRQRVACRSRDDAVQVLAVIDDQRRADRLPALRAAGAARQHRHAELAADVDAPRARRRRSAARARRPARPGRSTRRWRSGRARRASNSTSPSTARRKPRRRGRRVRGLPWRRSQRHGPAAIPSEACPHAAKVSSMAPLDSAWQAAPVPDSPAAPTEERLHDSSSTAPHPAAISCRFPGPTNVPDRVLRAIDRPTIDHRGPEFAALARSVIAGMKKVFQTDEAGRHLSGVGHRRVGSGARQHAVARRSRADVRDRPFRHALAEAGRAARASSSISCPATGATASTPREIEATLAADRGHAIKAVCVVHNETSTGVTLAHPRRARSAIDRAGHPGAADGRHDLVAGVDRLPPRRMGRRRHRRAARRRA